ncbi:hypothetical protein L3Q82_017283, partial [Scortum barcoo]
MEEWAKIPATDLVTMETSCESETRERKQRFVRHYSQQVGQQLSTLKELTAAILSYNQFNFSRLGPPLFPPLHLSLAPNLQHHPSPSPGYTTREKPSPELFVRSNPQWLPAEGNTEQLENQPEDKEEEPGSGRRVRLDLFLQIPSTSKTSTPQKEPQPWVHYVAMTPEEPEEPQFQLRLPSPSSDEHQRLPPIADCCTVAPSRAVQAQIQQDAPPKAERVGFQPQENLNQIHQQPLILPLLLPEPPPPVGVLGCVAGWKGPGKQSSLAFLQNRLLDLQDPCESSNANRGVVRDLQSDKSIGCLILGPDGEIIQLSLYEGSQNPSQGEGDTQEQEGGVELNTDAPVGHIQHRQSKHKTTEGLTSVGQFAEEECSFNAEQLIDHHRSTDAWSPRSHTDSVAATKRKTKTTVAGTWKEAKKDSKHKMRMPPLREHVGKEELRGGGTEEEEEEGEEDEEDISSGQANYLSGSQRVLVEKLQIKGDVSHSQQSISPNEATKDNAVDKRKKNTKRKGAEEAAISTGKEEMKMVRSAESDGQKTSRTRKEGRQQRQKTGSDAQSIKGRTQEERTGEKATEILNHSAHSPVKKTTDRERERGDGGRQREESAGRMRRRRRKRRGRHKESADENKEDPLEGEEMELSQEIGYKTKLKSSNRSSPMQRYSSQSNSYSEEDTDQVSTNSDKYSSVRSVSSLRSTAAASLFNQRSSRRSAASSFEGAVPASTAGLASSRGHLSSCSTVMVTEEQLMLNPVKPESSRVRKKQEVEEAAAQHLAERAERRRQEVERKRREREEEERKQQEREQTEDKMKSELEEERRKRAEELRLKRQVEEEERRRHEEEEQERARREQVQKERERRRQEERRRQMERLQKTREEEEQRRKAELERLYLEEERRQEEENKMLQEMDEGQRMEYLHRKEQEEEEKRTKEEERKRREEEAASRAAEEARLQAGAALQIYQASGCLTTGTGMIEYFLNDSVNMSKDLNTGDPRAYLAVAHAAALPVMWVTMKTTFDCLPGKVYARVLERRIRPIVDPRIQEEQCGFHPGRGILDQLYTLHRVLEGLWEFAQPVHMCFVDLEKAFDRVPRGILWGVLREYGVWGPLLRAVRSLYWPEQELGSHCKAMMLSCWLHQDQDLQHVLERFAAECEVAGMRISTSKSEAMVLDRKRVACPLRVGGEVLPQVEEFKYQGSCSRLNFRRLHLEEERRQEEENKMLRRWMRAEDGYLHRKEQEEEERRTKEEERKRREEEAASHGLQRRPGCRRSCSQ